MDSWSVSNMTFEEKIENPSNIYTQMIYFFMGILAVVCDVFIIYTIYCLKGTRKFVDVLLMNWAITHLVTSLIGHLTVRIFEMVGIYMSDSFWCYVTMLDLSFYVIGAFFLLMVCLDLVCLWWCPVPCYNFKEYDTFIVVAVWFGGILWIGYSSSPCFFYPNPSWMISLIPLLEFLSIFIFVVAFITVMLIKKYVDKEEYRVTVHLKILGVYVLTDLSYWVWSYLVPSFTLNNIMIMVHSFQLSTPFVLIMVLYVLDKDYKAYFDSVFQRTSIPTGDQYHEFGEVFNTVGGTPLANRENTN